MKGGPAEPVLAYAQSYLFDLDGCIWFGDQLAPGADALVRDLRASGARLGFLTNASVADAAGLAAKLERLGIPAGAEDVLAPLDVLVRHPRIRGNPAVLVLGVDDIRRTLTDAGATVVDAAEDADVVVLGKDPDLTYARLAEATHALDLGAGLVALNADASVPGSGGRRWPGVGAIAAALTTASGVRPDVVGKPSAYFFDIALDKFAMERERTVMVGDRPDTDIRGGNAAHLTTVLVGDAEPREERDEPDLRVADLFELQRRLVPS